MPSLDALREFRDSFNNIAGEKKDVLAANLPFDDLPIPKKEPPPFDPPRDDTKPPAFTSSASNPASASDALPSNPAPADAFDFSALLHDTVDSDLNPDDALDNILGGQDAGMPVDDFFGGQDDPPSIDDILDQEVPSPPVKANVKEKSKEREDVSGLDDFLKDISATRAAANAQSGSDTADTGDPSFLADLLGDGAKPDDALGDILGDMSGDTSDDGSFPADLLSGFSDDVESAPSDFPADDFPTGDTGAGDEEAFNFDEHPMDIQPEGFDDFPEDEDDEEEEGINMGGETRTGEFNVEHVDTTVDEETDDVESAPPSGDSLGDDFGSADFPTDGLSDGLSDDFLTDGLPDDSIDLGGESPAPSSGDEFGGDAGFGDDLGDPFAGLDFPGGDDSGAGSSGGDGFDAGGDSGFGDDLGDPLSGLDFPGGDDSGAGSSGGDSGFGGDLGDPLSGLDFPSGDDSGTGSSGDVGGDAGFGEDLGDPLSGMDFPGGDSSSGLDDLGSEFSSDTLDIDMSSGISSNGGHGDDAFHIPGLEEMFGDKTDTIIPVQEKKGLFGRRKKKKEAEEQPQNINDVEEIALSQDDLNNVLKTLSTYPLNLRVACEEMIAEMVILPQQLSKLLNLLKNSASVKETAAHVESITGKPIVIPKSFQKGTGAAFEDEQSSFTYIFIHNFLPVLRLFAFIAAMAFSVIYLSYRLIYIPLRAESLYQRGYERIAAGEYQRANDLFQQAFALHRNKKWFYTYAEGFRDQRRYMLAEGKYEELLRFYPRDKKGILDYSVLQTYYMLNYDKANRLLQRELLDFAPDDYHGLLASGDNFLIWGDSDPEKFFDKYEDARFAYARLLELNGWKAPLVERMLKYFIRVDNLYEVLVLRNWFEALETRRLGAESLSELAGYLLDKQLEKPQGVPNAYIESIESVRAMLLKAIEQDRIENSGVALLPEPHYHLARYHKNLGNIYEERLALENAIRGFNLAKSETVKRRLNRVDTHYRLADLMINNREFFPAESELIKGIELYNDFLSRNLIRSSPQLGKLYASKGDLEFYVKTGDKTAASNALADYRRAEEAGFAPPEMLYRMGAAHYQLEDWGNALNYLFKASTDMPLNRRTLYALGNAAYQRGDYFAAQGYYNRLLDTLENQRVRQPVLLPNDNPQFLELGERLMMARNNAGVVNEILADQTGNREYRSTALALYAESARAWDTITRNPETMVRMRLSEIPGAPGINLGYLNAANAMRPVSSYNPGIFVRIDRDGEEPSKWEELAPFGGR